jgi:hypothetical protein
MFVKKPYRNSSVVHTLIAGVANDIKAHGGSFLRGESDVHLESLYSRCAVVVRGAECYFGGEKFDALACSAGLLPRQMLRTLSFLSRHQ